ncbi:MAG: hypothetical protein N2746_03795 [Deltaproteobacteria bacterium]|nr:hypothetical protein [Deltaproteobacteria bacterium]
MSKVINSLSTLLVVIFLVFISFYCSDSATTTTQPDVMNCPIGTKPYGKKCIPIDKGVVEESYEEEDVIVEEDVLILEEEDTVLLEEGVRDYVVFDKGNPKICNPKERQCIKGDLYECNGDGTQFIMIESCRVRCDIIEVNDAGVETKYCITGCAITGCVKEKVICEPLSYHCCGGKYIDPDGKCGSDDLLQCNELGTKWGTIVENCKDKYGEKSFCYIDHCKDQPPPKCNPGELKCTDGKNIYQCTADGSKWVLKESCPVCCIDNPISCSKGTGVDNAPCETDCDCDLNYKCVGFGFPINNKVCRQKCGIIGKECPSGYTCTSGYYCVPGG